MIRLENLSLHRDTRRSLPAFVSIPSGTNLSVIGPTGGGKTALSLGMIGLCPDGQASADLIIDGARLDSLDARERARLTAFVPSNPALLFSGIRNTLLGELEMSLQIVGVGEQPGRAAINRWVKRLELQGLLNQNPFTLSGGETVRAALALCLAKQPRLIVLDDIFGAVAEGGKQLIRAALAEDSSCSVIETSSAVSRLVMPSAHHIMLPGPVVPPQTLDCQIDATFRRALATEHPAGPCLEISSLTFRYPGNDAFSLGPINIRLARGQLGLVGGENGSGKSTLLRLIAQLLLANGGTEAVVGWDGCRNPPPVKRHRHLWAKQVLYCFQEPDDQIFMPTVAAELGLTALKFGMSPQVLALRLGTVARALDLSSFLSSRPMDLPRPKRRLTTLASCLVANPPLLLLDEPTAGLDDRERRLVVESIYRYVNEGGCALVVTHQPNEFGEAPRKDFWMSCGSLSPVASPTDGHLFPL